MNKKEEEKRQKWGNFFGKQTHEEPINSNLKSIQMEGINEEKNATEEVNIKQNEFIKELSHSVATDVWSQLPYERHGEVMKAVTDILRHRHEQRIQECAKALEGLKIEYEAFQKGL